MLMITHTLRLVGAELTGARVQRWRRDEQVFYRFIPVRGRPEYIQTARRLREIFEPLARFERKFCGGPRRLLGPKKFDMSNRSNGVVVR